VTARPPCRRSAGDTLRFAQNSPAHAGEVARRHHNSLSRQQHSVSSDRLGGSCRCTPMTTWLAPWLGVPRRTGVDRAGPGRHGARHPRSTTPVAAERRTPGALGLPFGTAGSTVGAGGFLLAGTPLPEVAARARQQRRPVRVQSVATMPGRMGHASRWPVPEVDDLPGLADCWSFHSAAVLGRRQSWTAAPHPGGPTAPLPRPLGDQTRCRPAAARVAHAAAARRAVTSPRPHPLLGAPAPGGPWLRPGAQRPDQRTAAPGSGRRGLPRPADLLRDHHGPAGERAVHRHGLPGGGGMDAHRTVQPSDARPRPARDARRRRQHCSAPAAGRAAGPSLPAGSTDVSCAGQPGRFRPRPPARRLRLGSRADLQPVRRRSDLLRSRSRRAAPRLIRAVTEIARGRVS
jgi:hypothetical protein